jgi:glycosyltransferase involved in cell wall biosynthesis
MSDSRVYVLVTPVKNEEQSIGKTIDAVVAQTIRPVEWVIASDGSTDSTNEIVRGYLLKNPWIRLLELPPRERRCFSSVVLNTMTAISHLESTDHAYIGLLDADVVFDADYYEKTMRCFERDPILGLAGGVVIDPGESRDRVPRNRFDIPGAVQFYRKECFEDIGGLIAIPEGGWDGVACVMARMAGYRTSLLCELVIDHLKPRNVSQGSVLKRRWQMGLRDFAVGYHPCFEVVKCLSRIGDTPWIAGSFSWWCGYVSGWIANQASIVPEPVRQHLRHEQIERIKKVLLRSLHSIKPLKTSTIPNPETP